MSALFCGAACSVFVRLYLSLQHRSL